MAPVLREIYSAVIQVEKLEERYKGSKGEKRATLDQRKEDGSRRERGCEE